MSEEEGPSEVEEDSDRVEEEIAISNGGALRLDVNHDDRTSWGHSLR